jgi:hypothetical protein
VSRALLIIACSQRKAAGTKIGAAWDVYDGVVYRVLKKRLGPKHNWSAWLDILIVSAKYGIIRPGRMIRTYDQAITTDSLAGRWAGSLRRLIRGRDYRFVHVNLGRTYQAAIGDVVGLFPRAEVAFSTGGIGERAAQTAAWIEARIASGITCGTIPSSSRSRPLSGCSRRGSSQ